LFPLDREGRTGLRLHLQSGGKPPTTETLIEGETEGGGKKESQKEIPEMKKEKG